MRNWFSTWSKFASYHSYGLVRAYIFASSLVNSKLPMNTSSLYLVTLLDSPLLSTFNSICTSCVSRVVCNNILWQTYIEKIGRPWFSFTLRMRNVTTNMTSASARRKNGTNHLGSFVCKSFRLLDRSIYAVRVNTLCKYNNNNNNINNNKTTYK